MSERPWPWAVAVLGCSVLALAAGGCDQRHGEPALVDGCRKVLVTDSMSGESLRGIEDIALDRRSGRAYLSAYDRPTVERRPREGGAGDPEMPQGGIYLLDLGRLADSDALVTVTDVTTGFKAERRLHPHGIDLMVDDRGGTLVAVNRAGTERGREGAATTVEVFELADPAASGDLVHRTTVRSPRFCRANEVAVLSRDRFLVSLDGEACDGPARWLELALGQARGAVLAAEIVGDTVRLTPVAEGVPFANGLSVTEDHLVVAATRGEALLLYPREMTEAATAAEPERVIAIGAGPDNLSLTADGRVVVAVHPSLPALARYRHRWLGEWLRAETAPSRVIEVDPGDGGSRRRLYGDDDGRLLSAVTVAVVHDGLLVAGSVIDEGLLVCPYPPLAAASDEGRGQP